MYTKRALSHKTSDVWGDLGPQTKRTFGLEAPRTVEGREKRGGKRGKGLAKKGGKEGVDLVSFREGPR